MTIYDIAKIAGVSASTVSRVVGGIASWYKHSGNPCGDSSENWT